MPLPTKQIGSKRRQFARSFETRSNAKKKKQKRDVKPEPMLRCTRKKKSGSRRR